MTLQRFQGIVLRISNLMFVRHYLWLNYPNDAQLMGIELGRIADTESRVALHHELTKLGFSLRDDGIWTIGRTADAGRPDAP